MKKGWRTRKLGDVLEIQNGYAFDSAGFNPTKGMPLIRIRSLKPGTETETRFDGGYDKKYVVGAGDLLIGMDGEFGCYEWKGEPALLNQRVCRLQGFSHELVPRFLFYGVNDYLKEIEDITGYATVKHLSSKQILSIEFPVPPLPEQKRIVGILDEAFEGIATAKANGEKNLRNARAIFESHLQSVFTQRGKGWLEKRLSDIAHVKGGKRIPKGYKLQTEPTDYPYLRVTEFTDFGTIDTRDLHYVSPEAHREIKNYVIYSTDLYISIAGTIGKTGIIPEELDGAHLTENACRLVFNPNVSNRFVYYFTVTPNFVEQAGLNTRTAAQPKLALSRLATIKLGIPPFAEQKRLAEEFDTLREETQRLESIYQRKLAALGALKKSLLHQAFTGQL